MLLGTINPQAVLLLQRSLLTKPCLANSRNVRSKMTLKDVDSAPVQFLPEHAFGIESACGARVAAQRELQGRTTRSHCRRTGVRLKHLSQRV